MRLVVVLAAAAGLTMAASGAMAQDIYSGGGNWTGFYFGAQANLLATKSLEENAPGLVAPTLLGDMGGGAGVFAGADYQLNDMLVAGVMGEFNWDSTELLLNGATYGNARWDGALRARLGVPVAPNVLAYGSIGYSWGHFDYSPGLPTPPYSNTEFTVAGAQFGIGVDAKLTDTIMGRIEATYTHFGSNVAANAAGPNTTSTPSLIAVKAGVGVRFD
jgi:opacity protein-like surface antigen